MPRRAIHRVKIYPVDKAIGFPNVRFHWMVIYQVGRGYPTLEQLGSGC